MHLYSYKVAKKLLVLLLICGLLVINRCSCNKTAHPLKPSEIILFLGNTGVGKSTICNSIFQQAVFSSGLSMGFGMTFQQQEHVYQNALYVDTPGLSYEEIRGQAAKEIEEALRKNSNYKIIFVITLKAGRLSPTDIATVETVCEAIQVPFEYGLIFNKISGGIMKVINQKGLDGYLTSFKKKPYATTLLQVDDEIEDMPNLYFKPDSENRKKLLEFLSKLKSIQINESDIKPLNIKNYEQKLEAIGSK